MSRVAQAMVRVTPSRMLCATRSGSYLSFLIALRTRLRTSSLTDLWPLRTRETVPMATSAARATSWIVGLRPIIQPNTAAARAGDCAQRSRSLWSSWYHNNLAEEVPRFHEGFGLAKLLQGKGAHLRPPNFAIGHVDHAAANILLGIAVGTADLDLALP